MMTRLNRLSLVAVLVPWLGLALASGPARGAGAPAVAAGSRTEVRLRRFALMVGVNDGGPQRARLRYAASDARAMAHVLESLGGVAPGDLVVVADASRRAMLDGFASVDRLVRAEHTPGVRRELLVYYSGHSDEEGLLIGRDRIGYDELRARIRDVPADLRVAILDSCGSGAFTRSKGGVRRPPFLLDASIDMRGHAYLTSSAANEVAQESDRIAASFFTHYLISGLRGAADANQDRRVTLQEAFQFASQETLARTELTQGGPQHAAYEFDLTGTGDMVVTDVRTTQAGLVLASALGGRISVREAGGALVAELRKPAGNTVELGVDAGSYIVSVDAEDVVLEARVTLAAGEHAALGRLAFHPVGRAEVTVARGDGGPAATATAAAMGPAGAAGPGAVPPPPHEQTPLKAGFIPRAPDGRTDVDGFSFGFVADRAARLKGMQLAIGYAQVDEALTGLQLTAGVAAGGGSARGIQVAAAATYLAGELRGVQLAGGANVAGVARGLQAAGGVNVVLAEGRGAQVAGGINMADRFTGLQLAPLNVARQVAGAQVGVVNVADTATGFRLATVNVARQTRGFQLGVINVAERDDGESFGLLSFIGNGIHDVEAYASDTMLSNVAVELGSRHVYTELSVGYQPGDDLQAGTAQFSRDSRRWGFGGGIGYRFRLDAGWLTSLDLEAHTLNVRRVANSWDGRNPMVSSLRAVAGFRLAPHLVVMAGLTANVALGQDGQDADLALGPGSVIRSGASTIRLYPGALLGVRI
jgi:Caspase domain